MSDISKQPIKTYEKATVRYYERTPDLELRSYPQGEVEIYENWVKTSTMLIPRERTQSVVPLD